jgi:hypothetical protein
VGVKVFIVIVAALVVLFVVGVAAPAIGGGDQTANPQGGVADRLRGLVERPLDPQADAQASPADCLLGRAVVLPAGGSCTLAVKALEGWFVPTRRLELRLEQGMAKVQLRQAGGLDIDHTLEPADPAMTVNILRDGATVTIVCAGALQACGLSVAP